MAAPVHLGQFLSNPQADFEGFMATIDETVRTHLASLVAIFPDSSYPGNLFKNVNRTNEVLKAAGL